MNSCKAIPTDKRTRQLVVTSCQLVEPQARLLAATWCTVLGSLLVVTPFWAAEEQSKTQAPTESVATAESLSDWAFYADIQIPPETESQLVDVILPPSVFEGSRLDLQDLRVYTTQGKEIPYALRKRSKEYSMETVAAQMFNRTQGPDGVSELSLRLEGSNVQHNTLEIELPGKNYRRPVEIDGSDDGSNWRLLHKQNLINFQRGDEELKDETVSYYPPSRYPYLRLRVYRDPLVDEEPVEIGEVSVLRKIEIPGERLSLEAQMGNLNRTQGKGAPGSSWISTLGGDDTPVDRIEVTIADVQFARDYQLEAGGPPDTREKFRPVTSDVWQRRAGEEMEPMVASFRETRAARLRLTVTDHRNDPLQVQKVMYSADARQVVFERPPGEASLRLYFGNPNARATQYDFARNLPERLDPEPLRATLGARTDNPIYVPEPLPFTERWPWLIYGVLSAVIVVLAGVLLNLSRTAIQTFDSTVADSVA